jgi:hypothetical protein
MFRRINPLTRGAVGLLATFALIGATELPVGAPDGDPEAARSECELTLRPAEVPRGPENPVVRATLSGEIGEISRVTVQDRSRVRVEQVEKPGPAALVITLRTEDAEAGEWTVTAVGETGECTGQITVQGGSGPGID